MSEAKTSAAKKPAAKKPARPAKPAAAKQALSGKTVKVRQKGSGIGHGKVQIATLRGLGLGRVRRERVLADTPEVRGMIKRVAHLVEVE
jgi:large subunit ribosomal protein L30